MFCSPQQSELFTTIISKTHHQDRVEYNCIRHVDTKPTKFKMLGREVPDRLYDHTYEHLKLLREKLAIMEYQPSTFEKTMSVKQLYQQGSPAWARTCSAEKISSIRSVEKTLKDCGAPNTLSKFWDEIVGSEDIPPLWVMLDRTYTVSAAWRKERKGNK